MLSPTCLNDIFEIENENEFEKLAIEIFNFQYEHTPVYRNFVELLGINPEKVTQIHQIPFLPIQFFKTHKVLSNFSKSEFYFESSGTTRQIIRSKHYIHSVELYRKSLLQGWKRFFSPPEELTFLAILPHYSQNPRSSLIFMVRELMNASPNKHHGFFLNDFKSLFNRIQTLELNKEPFVLFGVSYALLDFIQSVGRINLKHGLVLETGGMKGRKKEISKQELFEQLKKGFGTENIFSEYGMTELLSQSYSNENLTFQSPPWKKVIVRDLNDPLFIKTIGSGALNIIDLANVYSCSFIATDDLAQLTPEGFQIIGRKDHSDVRGCSLLVSE